MVHLRYDYDAHGNVSAMTDNSLSGRQTRAMTYDGLDRLLTTTSPLYPGGATYAHDVLDNLTRVSVAGRDHRYAYDGNNRLVSATQGPGGPVALTLGYDARGNLSSRNGQAFGFDLGNRLRTAPGAESYRYDAHGRRARTSNPSSTLYELYAQDGTLMWQHDTGAGFRFRHVYLNGRAVALHRLPVGSGGGEVVFTWHTDAQGSQLAASDGPAVLQTSEYEPYGKLLNRANNNRIGYTGHVMDAGTGLVQMQQRYYDPGIGAMLSVDPVTAYEQTITNFCRYCYGRNNPYKFTDPDGRQSWPTPQSFNVDMSKRVPNDVSNSWKAAEQAAAPKAAYATGSVGYAAGGGFVGAQAQGPSGTIAVSPKGISVSGNGPQAELTTPAGAVQLQASRSGI